MKHSDSQQVSWTFLVLVILTIVNLHESAAKDLRQVTEPKIPPACVSLKGSGGDETAVIQKALNSCAKGKTVHLASGNFVSGPLTIPSGVGLWIDTGVVLKASSNPTEYDQGRNLCGTQTNHGDCSPFIHIKDAIGSGIYGKGTIDGQGGVKLTGKGITWWDLKNTGFNRPRLIQIDSSRDITLYQITLINSPDFHVVPSQTNGFTAWGVTIHTPAHAPNTDGIDPAGSQNVTIAHCSISTGDDNVAIKGGNAATSHVSITNNHFGSGHGMSIGSETNAGVSDVTVTSLTLEGTTNGLRIKSDRSRGGLVTGISYTDICMRNVKNPIVLNTAYHKSASGNQIPEFRDITFNNVKVVTKGKYVFNGFSDAKPIQAALNNVHIAKGSTWTEAHAKISGKYSEDATGSC